MIRVKIDVVGALKAKGYSAFAMSRDLNINTRISRKLIAGKAPGMKLLATICRELDLQPSDILEWEPDENTVPERRPWAEVVKELPLYMNIVPGEICFKVDILEALHALGYTAREAHALKILNSSAWSDFRAGRMLGPVQIDRLCNGLHCQPGDLIEYAPEEENNAQN